MNQLIASKLSGYARERRAEAKKEERAARLKKRKESAKLEALKEKIASANKTKAKIAVLIDFINTERKGFLFNDEFILDEISRQLSAIR